MPPATNYAPHAITSHKPTQNCTISLESSGELLSAVKSVLSVELASSF